VSVTVGIDLAAQPKSTGVCSIRWSVEHVVVDRLGVGATDEDLLWLIASADKVGIDVPLGWPVAFVRALSAYGSGQGWVDAPMQELRLRATDRYVARETHTTPLSVAADKIAAPAMRAASLLDKVPFPVNRAGAGIICEVYPAAALCRWGLDPLLEGVVESRLRYKGRADHGGPMRLRLVHALRRIVGSWLQATDAQWAQCIAQDDALDALLCALIARAAEVGSVDAVPEPLSALAAIEGWITLPSSKSLGGLADAGVERAS
jgi:predicted nuclease with RNAse H fold